MQSNSNLLPQQGFARLQQLVGNPEENQPPIVPVSKSTIWNWVKQGRFPKPIKLSPSVTAWRVEDIRAFLEQGESL